MTIWGNHSATQYPDLFHAEVGGKNAAEVVGDQDWIENTFIPTVAKRGAAIIEARGSSSAASAASATIDAARDWLFGSADGDWVSMAVVSDGSYGVPEGLVSSFPVTTTRRRLGDRPGPRHRRLLPRPDRRLRRRARRGARRGQGARADLAARVSPAGSGIVAAGRSTRRRAPPSSSGVEEPVADGEHAGVPARQHQPQQRGEAERRRPGSGCRAASRRSTRSRCRPRRGQHDEVERAADGGGVAALLQRGSPRAPRRPRRAPRRSPPGRGRLGVGGSSVTQLTRGPLRHQHDVGQQHRAGHRADAAGVGRDPAGDVPDVVGDVAGDLAVDPGDARRRARPRRA